MKEKPVNHVEDTQHSPQPEVEVENAQPEAPPIPANEKKVLFSDIKNIQNRGVWDKFVKLIRQVKFPSVYGIKGLTHNLQFRIYPIQNDMAQQIFEYCKGMYKTRSHLDRRIYTIGLEWLRIEHLELGEKIKSTLSPVLFELMEEDKVDEEKNQVIIKYKDYMVKVCMGIMTQEMCDNRIQKMINCFPKDQQEHIEIMLDSMDLGGEMVRAEHRLRQRKYRDRKKIADWKVEEGGRK
jgi:hypothetical protein